MTLLDRNSLNGPCLNDDRQGGGRAQATLSPKRKEPEGEERCSSMTSASCSTKRASFKAEVRREMQGFSSQFGAKLEKLEGKHQTVNAEVGNPVGKLQIQI